MRTCTPPSLSIALRGSDTGRDDDPPPFATARALHEAARARRASREKRWAEEEGLGLSGTFTPFVNATFFCLCFCVVPSSALSRALGKRFWLRRNVGGRGRSTKNPYPSHSLRRAEDPRKGPPHAPSNG